MGHSSGWSYCSGHHSGEQAAQGSRASGSSNAVAALDTQLTIVSGGEITALDAPCDRKDAARSYDKGVALCLREQRAEGAVKT